METIVALAGARVYPSGSRFRARTPLVVRPAARPR
jgi:hypothetical protein